MQIAARTAAWHESARLPKEFWEVEYIRGTGNQYIDTGFVPQTNGRLEMVAACDVIPSSGIVGLFGRYGGTYGRFNVGRLTSSGYVNPNVFAWDFSNTNERTDFPLDTEKHTFVLDAVSQTLKIDSSVFQREVSSEPIHGASGTCYLFKVNNSGSPSQARVWSCKIYDNDSIVVDLVPCIRRADNMVGMFDVVQNVFRTNIGTGAFEDPDE